MLHSLATLWFSKRAGLVINSPVRILSMAEFGRRFLFREYCIWQLLRTLEARNSKYT